MNAQVKQFALVPPTSIATLVQDLGEIKNVLASLVVVANTVVELAPTPALVKGIAVAGQVLAVLGVVISDLRAPSTVSK